MKKKRLLIITTLLLIITLISIIFITQHYKTTYHSVSEIYTDLNTQDLPLGKEYHFKDKVLEVRTFQLPEISWDYIDLQINLRNITTYTEVTFDTYNEAGVNYTVFFRDDVTSDFKIGEEIEFTQVVEQFYFGGQSYQRIGSTAIIYKINNYVLYSQADMIPKSIDSEILRMNQTSRYTISITNVSDYYPNPIKWSEVTLYIRNGEQGPVDSTSDFYTSLPFRAYDNNGIQIGSYNLTSPISSEEFLSNGSYLEFYVDESYGDYWSIRIERTRNIFPFKDFIIYQVTIDYRDNN